MRGESWAALITGIVAGLVAVMGFLFNQIANRRERKSKVYAEALTALKEYTELPFRIRRRASSSGDTRAVLGEKISDVLSQLGFYYAWLQIDSYEVGMAYQDLVDQTKRFGGRYRAAAWKGPLIARDEDATLAQTYRIDNGPELDNCLLAMRRELSLWAFLTHRRTRALLAEQRRRRAEHDTRHDRTGVPADPGAVGEDLGPRAGTVPTRPNQTYGGL
jgi:hypothetical protein